VIAVNCVILCVCGMWGCGKHWCVSTKVGVWMVYSIAPLQQNSTTQHTALDILEYDTTQGNATTCTWCYLFEETLRENLPHHLIKLLKEYINNNLLKLQGN
jgi:hypothetical protein